LLSLWGDSKNFEQVISRLQEHYKVMPELHRSRYLGWHGTPTRLYLDMVKGYLKRSKKLIEDEAFKLMHWQSMDFGKAMRAITEPCS